MITEEQAEQNLKSVYARNPVFPPESTTLRFVLLSPGKDDETPSCIVIEGDMYRQEYEALSYTWGLEDRIKPHGFEWEGSSDASSWEDVASETSDQASEAEPKLPSEQKYHIACNGLLIPVMRNLYVALQYLRYSARERILWIDYICINQDSIEDKNSQVRRMDEIYRHASKVVVWLGLVTADTQVGIKSLRRLNENIHLTTVFGKKPLSEDQIQTHIKPLVNLISRGWFQRVWVVQEVALSRHVQVQIGDITLPWHTFITAARTIGNHLGCCSTILRPVMYDLDGDYLLSLRECFANILAIDIKTTKPDLTLHEALRIFYGRLATDPRDKVFGILGLLDPDRRLIDVDYGVKTPELYAATAAKVITESGDLSVLVDTDELAGNINVPTWCPDWTNISPLGVNFYHFFNAAGASRATGTLCTPLSLKLKGMVIDFVTDIVPDNSTSQNDDGSSKDLQWEAFQQLKKWEDLVQMKFGLDKEYLTGESYETAFWHTVMTGLNRTRTARLDKKDDRAAWDSWRAWLSRHSSSPRALKAATARLTDASHISHNELLVEYLSTRWFFVTEDGYLGLGPVEMEEGDMVCVFAGGKMPFAVRAVDPSCEVCRDEFCYAFVGCAYLHGFMDGAAGLIESVEEGKEMWRSFCLR
jgi:hypothetical protein